MEYPENIDGVMAMKDLGGHIENMGRLFNEMILDLPNSSSLQLWLAAYEIRREGFVHLMNALDDYVSLLK